MRTVLLKKIIFLVYWNEDPTSLPKKTIIKKPLSKICFLADFSFSQEKAHTS
jgi:hypothetical protein